MNDYQDEAVTVHLGDVREVLSQLPSESVQCVVTSPPYWGLRDYGTEGQLGREASPDEYVCTMTAVFEEVRRVLRSDGTCWVNMGDCWNSGTSAQRRPSGNHGGNGYGKHGYWTNPNITQRAYASDLKTKDLVGVPWMLAFSLRGAGWWLRSDIIWSKPNPMPESVTDRPTKSHEYLFLLTKSASYYYDADAIRVAERGGPAFGDERRSAESAGPGQPPQRAAVRKIKMPDGWDTGSGGHGSYHRNGREKGKQREIAAASVGSTASEDAGTNRTGANRRSVWEIATKPYPDAHFATFPEELARIPILAGTRPRDVVLDPFAGSGTTLMVAKSLDRQALGIELNPAYLPLIRKRVESVAAQVGLPL